MIEDILDNPRREFRWFAWAFLVLGGLTFAMWILLVVIASVLGPMEYAVGLQRIPVPVFSQIEGSPIVPLAFFVHIAGFATKTQLVNEFFVAFSIVALITLRNFLSAFRTRRPRLMASVGVAPLLYLGSYYTVTTDYAVCIAIALASLVWVQAVPIPKSGVPMRSAVKGFAMGAIAATMFQVGSYFFEWPGWWYLGVVLAFSWTAFALVKRRPFEAAMTATCASLPSLVYLAGAAASGATYGLQLLIWSLCFGLGLVAMAIDTFFPALAEPEPVAESPEPGEDAASDPSEPGPADPWAEPRTFGRHLPFVEPVDNDVEPGSHAQDQTPTGSDEPRP